MLRIIILFVICFVMYDMARVEPMPQSVARTELSKQDPTMVQLFGQAKKLMNYKGDLAMPRVIPATQDEMQELMCPGEECNVSGVYFSNKIYYLKGMDLNDPINRSILVHEFIHHIQRDIHGDTTDCERWYSNEHEAYSKQKQYLMKKGINTAFMNRYAEVLKCPS